MASTSSGQENRRYTQKRIYCSENNCQYKCLQINEFREHLKIDHKKQMDMIEKYFKSKKEFDAWNYMLSKSASVTWCVAYTKVTRHGKSVFYECNRSGRFVSRLERIRRLRRMKKKGSVKCGRRCTATMVATFQTDGSVKAVACTTHYGHGNEPSMQRIHPVDKKIIGSRCLQDVPMDTIIKTTRMNAPSTSRLSLLHHRDVRNIVKSMKSARRKFGEISFASRLKKSEEARAVKSIIENNHSDVNSAENDEIEDEEVQKRLADIKLLRSDLIISCREIESLIHCVENVDALRRMGEALNEVKSLASDALEPKSCRTSKLFIPPTTSTLVVPPTTSELAVLPMTKARTILQKKVEEIVQPLPKKVSMSKIDEHVRIRDAISLEPVLTAIVLDEHSNRAYSFPGLVYYLFPEASLDTWIKNQCPLKVSDMKLTKFFEIDQIDLQYHASFLEYKDYDSDLAKLMERAALDIVRTIISKIVEYWRCDICKVSCTNKKMLACDGCQKWFHWTCLGLAEKDEIHVKKIKKLFCNQHLYASSFYKRPLQCKPS